MTIYCAPLTPELGFAVLLKHFQYEGRFPSQKQDIPAAVTRHIAHQLGVATEEPLTYDWMVA